MKASDALLVTAVRLGQAVATRCEKTVENYLGVLHVAAALDWIQRMDLESHGDVAQTQLALASLLKAEGHTKEATTLFAEALPTYRAVLGSARGQTATLMESLATLKREAGDDAAASALYCDVIEMEQERLGKEHRRVAMLRAAFGACLTALGRYEEAERHLHTSHATLKSQGNQDDEVGAVLEHLVTLYDA